MAWRSGLFWFVGATVFVAAAAGTAAESATTFTLTDPKGDDRGSGYLVYPERPDMVPGDLDLLSLSARTEGEGTVFEAVFAHQVRPPWRQTIDKAGTTLDQVAKLGFYAFNIDIYIDTDRLPSSGSTATLPGRKVTVDSKFSWEKVICLTPQPYEAKDTLTSIFEREAQGQADAVDKKAGTVDARLSSVFFPTLVWVKGPRISFFVPNSFLGGPASAKWAYVVAVSGADLSVKLNSVKPTAGKATTGKATTGKDDKSSRLMILPIEPGKPTEAFGGAPEEDDLISPLVDIIVPKGMSQESVLKSYDLRTGSLAALPGVVPAEQ
jgi:hypothetical protein